MKYKKRPILQNSKTKKIIVIALSSLVLIMLSTLFFMKYFPQRDIDYSTYQTLLENGMIDSAKIGNEYVYIKSGGIEYKIPKEFIDTKELYKKVPVKMQENYQNFYDFLAIMILAFFVGYLVYYLKRQRKEPIPIKHQIQIAPAETPEMKMDIKPQVSAYTFDDVAGIDEVKEELEEIIDFLKDPKKYTSFGVRMPKGVLLVGPPGVGKTLIAKAVAGEAGVPFFYQSGSAFVQIYVGMGAKRVRELFKKAKEMAPSIVFIDEIDAVGKARGGMRNDEREATLNQLLTEMDGFEASSGVIVIGATNKIEVLDEALLRPGRFDRRIYVALPNKEDRMKILKIYLRKIPHNVDLERLADMSVGFSGAALASLVNEAALHALKLGKKIVELSDFEAVKDKVLYGKKKLLVFDEKEKEIQSVYQAAKALCAYWYGVDFDKLTLVGGYLKDIDREIVSKQDFMSKIKALLAGYVALQLKYNETFSNAAEDLKRVKVLAEEMVMRYGMGDRLFADVNDAIKIVEEAKVELKEYLSSHFALVEKIATYLQEHESVTKEDVKRVVDAVF